MSSPVATTFGKTSPKQMDFARPEGCDHDQSVYHYRLVDGAMVFRAVALGPRWESRQMDWRGLSCYKEREDEQMALITKESGRPEARADKDEIMAKARVLIDGGMNVSQAARELGVPAGTLHNWVNKARKNAEKADKDDEPIPYVVVKPEPIDAQIDIMLDILWAEKRAKLKAHLKPLLSDVEVWDMVKHIVSRGLA